jgi:hypothetical protein
MKTSSQICLITVHLYLILKLFSIILRLSAQPFSHKIYGLVAGRFIGDEWEVIKQEAVVV